MEPISACAFLPSAALHHLEALPLEEVADEHRRLAVVLDHQRDRLLVPLPAGF
jgi:hypothetical protein